MLNRAILETDSFNSRAREGRDYLLLIPRHIGGSFNSRAREGRDIERWNDRPSFEVSIHAPARGATGAPRWVGSVRPSFNSRAREGRDTVTGGSSTRRGGFNSRAREGRDRSTPTTPRLSSRFN